MSLLTLLLLTGINLLNYLDRYLLAALLPSVQEELALSHEAGGTLVSAFVIGYFIFSPIFGYLGDRVSRPVLMAVGVMLWSLATASTSQVSTFGLLMATRILVGVGEASFATIAPGYIKDRASSPEQLNLMLSVFYTAIPVGAALAYALCGILITSTPWRSIFLIAGIPGIVLALLLLAQREHRGSTSTEIPPLLPGLRRIWADSNLRFAIGGYALQAFALNGVAAWIISLGKLRGFGYEHTNTVFGIILVVTGLLGTLLGGKLSTILLKNSPDTIRTLFRFTAYSSVIGIPSLMLCFHAKSQGVFFASCAVAELMIFAGTAPLNSLIVLAAPPSLVTLTQGVTIATINLCGAFLAPLLVGRVADTISLPLGLQLCTIALGGAVVLWILGGRVRAEHQSCGASGPVPGGSDL